MGGSRALGRAGRMGRDDGGAEGGPPEPDGNARRRRARRNQRRGMSGAAGDTAARPLMSERRVGLIGALLTAVGPISMAVFTPAMPELVDAFGTTEAAVKLTLSLYFAGFAFAQLVCGPLSDGFGRKP